MARGASNVLGRVSGRVSDLVRVLGGVAVIGGAGVLYGCGAMTSAVGVQQGRPELVAFGEGLTQLEAAERGRSDVSQTTNVYGNSNNNQRNSGGGRLRNIIVTCNFYKGDINGTGFTELEDLENPKGTFSVGEPIGIVACFDWLQGQTLTIEIYDERGKFIEDGKWEITHPSMMVYGGVDSELGPGLYRIKAVASKKGNVGQTRFLVRDNKLSLK